MSSGATCWSYLCFFFGTGVWTQGLYLEPYHQPFFVMGFFEIGSCKLFCPVWLGMTILLIVSWVARIIGVSHWRSAWSCLFKTLLGCKLLLWEFEERPSNMYEQSELRIALEPASVVFTVCQLQGIYSMYGVLLVLKYRQAGCYGLNCVPCPIIHWNSQYYHMWK
jgi:hypothetical protein